MTSTSDSTETRAVLLSDHDPLNVLEQLPAAVFPIRLKLELSRNRGMDSEDGTFRPPEYPVPIRRPKGSYIPETTVYFDNPAERPPSNEQVWTLEDFEERMEELLAKIKEDSPVDPGELMLLELDVVEVPEQYLTTDPESGTMAVKPELYKREAVMRIGRFEKDGTLTASDVRDRLDDALPGESRTPTRLTEVKEVHAKESREGSTTQRSGGRAQYHTDSDAENNNDLSLTPAIYRLQHQSRSGDRSRPLNPVLSELDQFLPCLTSQASDLLNSLTFVGEERDRTVFHAREVLK